MNVVQACGPEHCEYLAAVRHVPGGDAEAFTALVQYAGRHLEPRYGVATYPDIVIGDDGPRHRHTPVPVSPLEVASHGDLRLVLVYYGRSAQYSRRDFSIVHALQGLGGISDDEHNIHVQPACPGHSSLLASSAAAYKDVMVEFGELTPRPVGGNVYLALRPTGGKQEVDALGRQADQFHDMVMQGSPGVGGRRGRHARLSLPFACLRSGSDRRQRNDFIYDVRQMLPITLNIGEVAIVTQLSP